MKTINIPPTTLNVAKIVSGNTTSYVRSTNMNGAHKNQARAQTVEENIRIFLRSAHTNSTVHTVRTHIPIEVAVFIANVGAISKATTCDSFTTKKKSVKITKFNKKNNLQSNKNNIVCLSILFAHMSVKIDNLRVSGINQVKYAKKPHTIPETPDQSHLLEV